MLNGNTPCIICKSLTICFTYYLQEVNIEFEAYSISDNDYGGIKKLLQQVQSFQNPRPVFCSLLKGSLLFQGEWLFVPLLFAPPLVTVFKFAMSWNAFLFMCSLPEILVSFQTLWTKKNIFYFLREEEFGLQFSGDAVHCGREGRAMVFM